MSKRNQNGSGEAIKRLVFAVYVKGSAGKTFLQAHLLQALWQWGIRARGYDPDTSFHRLEAMCGAERVTRLDFEDPESLSVPVMDLAEDKCDVAVIDGVGSQLAKQKAYFKAVDFFSNIAELDLVTTFVALIEDDTVIFEQVARMIGDVGSRADWVFVKNPKLFNEQFNRDGDQQFRFPVWDRSEIRRKALRELPSAEIVLPKLSQTEAAYLVERNATTWAAANDRELFVLQKSGFRTMWRRIESQLKLARPGEEFARANFWPDAAKIEAFFFRPLIDGQSAEEANREISQEVLV
jgi:hypothetical protein